MKVSASKSYQRNRKRDAAYFDSPAVREPSEWITVAEACKILNVTRMRIHQLSNQVDKDNNPRIARVKLETPGKKCRDSRVLRADVMSYKELQMARNAPNGK